MAQWTRRAWLGAALASAGGALAQARPADGVHIDRGWFPGVAVDARSGALYVVYGQGNAKAGDAFVRRSGDGGKSFSAPVRVNHIAGDVSGHDQGPAVLRVGPDGSLYVLWSVNRVLPDWKYGKGELRFAVSRDGGASFAPARTLNDDGANVSRNFHDMLVTGDGTIHLLFRPAPPFPGKGHAHHAGGESQMRMAASRDGGGSFEPSRLVAAPVCECCRPALAQAPGGGVFAAWRDARRNSVGRPVRDIGVAVYDARLAPQVKAGVAVADGWAYDACPHAGPAVAAVGSRMFLGWFSGQGPRPGLRLSCSDDGGRTFAAATELLGDAHVPPSLLAFAPAGDRALWLAWEDLRQAQPSIQLGLLPVTGKLSAPQPRRRVAGRFPALAAHDGRLYLVWAQGDETRLLVVEA